MSDEFVSAAQRLLRDRPVDRYWVEHSRRHRRLVLHYSGKAYRVIFPATPGDSFRGVQNFRADVAHALDALGVPKPIRSPSPHRYRNRCTAPRPVRPPVEKASPRADWRDALRAAAPLMFGGAIGVES